MISVTQVCAYKMKILVVAHSYAFGWVIDIGGCYLNLVNLNIIWILLTQNW